MLIFFSRLPPKALNNIMCHQILFPSVTYTEEECFIVSYFIVVLLKVLIGTTFVLRVFQCTFSTRTHPQQCDAGQQTALLEVRAAAVHRLNTNINLCAQRTGVGTSEGQAAHKGPQHSSFDSP